MSLEGLIAAPFTPMHPDGTINYDPIAAIADRYQRNHLAGVFIGGTTGEGFSLTEQERLELIHQWGKTVSEPFKLLVHVGHNCLETAKVLARQAQRHNAWGIGAIGPIFFKPTRIEDLVRYCREVAAAAPEIGFYYYHYPALTGLNFRMIDFLQAAAGAIPNLKGLKFTHDDLADLAQCVVFEGGRYDILMGRDEHFLDALKLGVRAAIGGTYNFAAPLYLELIEAFQQNNVKKAQSLQNKAVEMIGIIRRSGDDFLGAAKAIMKIIGIDCGPVRLPLRALLEEKHKILEENLFKIGFQTFCLT